MIVLVDYNNILETERRRGVAYVIDRIISSLDPEHLRQYRRVAIRLYDGWYELQSPTRYAQQLAADVQAAFPCTKTLSDQKGNFKLLVNVDLAYSLRCDPGVHIWHTYRPRSSISNITCRSPQAAGCQTQPCVLAPIQTFIATGRCPTSGCNIRPEDLFIRNEQKLVDSMIVADMFFSHLNSHAEVAVVSSDDDLWPAIRLLLSRGMKVFHIHTRPSRQTRAFYTQGVGADYVQLNL